MRHSPGYEHASIAADHGDVDAVGVDVDRLDRSQPLVAEAVAERIAGVRLEHLDVLGPVGQAVALRHPLVAGDVERVAVLERVRARRP